jgi:Ni,Fe-hydrogenase III small subunit
MLGRSIGIRHLVCGSCNGCEHEMNALTNSFYDITREGWDIVASPRHADVVTVTGPMTDAMRGPAFQTIDAVPRPRVILAIGDCATGDGPWCGFEPSGEGAGMELDATISVRGCPPNPDAIRNGLREAAWKLDLELSRNRRSKNQNTDATVSDGVIREMGPTNEN